MGKTIISPVKRFSGEVVLADPLTFNQVFAFQDAIATAQELGGTATVIQVNSSMIPGIIACVEEWKLENFPAHPTPDNFPATPIAASMKLIAWLVTEVSALFRESEEIPNE